MDRIGTKRRKLLSVLGLAVGTLIAAAAVSGHRSYPPAQALFQAGVCPNKDGQIQEIPVGDAASSVISDACDKGWSIASPAPSTPETDEGQALAALARNALRDVSTLSPRVAGIVPVQRVAYAGWSANWRYVWPRDAAFVGTALARTGQLESATEIYRFLAAHQLDDGTFRARYKPDGTPPDDRSAQFESVGWYVWGLSQLVAHMGPDERSALWAEFGTSILAATDAMLRETATGLPAPSSDYWERGETSLTLSTAAMTLAGLRAVSPIVEGIELPEEHSRIVVLAEATAARLVDEIVEHFGPDYGRYGGGTAPDAAVAFTLPPFQPLALPGAFEAWQESLPRQFVEVSGGYAPGAGWKKDGLSWTPETTLHAWVAAEAGLATKAKKILAWTAAHTTQTGAIPEKVSAEGKPSAVAPLAWSAANVVLAYLALDDHEPLEKTLETARP